MTLAFDTPLNTNDQSVDRVLAAGLPVVLVFLDGNPPVALEQAMERQARANAGNLLVAKVQVKDNSQTRQRFQITRTPAIVTLRNGQVLSQAEAVSADELEKHIAYLLGKGSKPEPKAAPQPGQAAQSTYTSRPPQEQAAGPRAVTDATFDREVLSSPQPTLVDFWAPWCGPCRIVEPVVEKLSHELAGRLNVAKINVDENPALAQRYEVLSIPTMLVVKNGQVIDRWMGALPEPALRERVARHVS